MTRPRVKSLVTREQLRRCLREPAGVLALGFGTGLAPRAPGTAGTLVGIPFYMLMILAGWPGYVLLTALLFAAGIWVCGRISRQLGEHDHGAIVWDEVVGYLVTMILVPLGFLNIVLGFLLFRLFDVLKPWPIGWVDRRVHGGLGIMMDDLIAGVIACLCTHAVLSLLVPWLAAVLA